MSAGRWLPLAAVTLLAGGFAWLNRGERVAVDVGVATVYRAPFTVVFFLAFLAGMLAMLALGLRHDLRLRRELRARGLLDAPRPTPAPRPVEEDASMPVSPPPPTTEAHAEDPHDSWRPALARIDHEDDDDRRPPEDAAPRA